MLKCSFCETDLLGQNIDGIYTLKLSLFSASMPNPLSCLSKVLFQDRTGGTTNPTTNGFAPESLMGLEAMATRETIVLTLNFQNINWLVQPFSLDGGDERCDFFGIGLSG